MRRSADTRVCLIVLPGFLRYGTPHVLLESSPCTVIERVSGVVRDLCVFRGSSLRIYGFNHGNSRHFSGLIFIMRLLHVESCCIHRRAGFCNIALFNTIEGRRGAGEEFCGGDVLRTENLLILLRKGYISCVPHDDPGFFYKKKIFYQKNRPAVQQGGVVLKKQIEKHLPPAAKDRR